MVSSTPPDVPSEPGVDDDDDDDDDDDAGDWYLTTESIWKNILVYLYLLFLLASVLEMAVILVICLFHSNFQIFKSG